MKTPSSKECENCYGGCIFPAVNKYSTCPCKCHTSKEEKSDLNKRFEELLKTIEFDGARVFEIREDGFEDDDVKKLKSFLHSEIQLEREKIKSWADEKLTMFGGLWVDERDHEYKSESRFRVEGRNEALLEVHKNLLSLLKDLEK